MAETSEGLPSRITHDRPAISSVGHKLRNFFGRKIESPSASTVETEEAKEIRTQRRLYGRGHNRFWSDIRFNYDKVQLDHSYTTQILQPFEESLKDIASAPLVVDIGSGKGEVGKYFEGKGIKVINADISPAGLRGSPNSVVVTGWRLPFADASFHGIHSKDMITHIAPQFREQFFSEIQRVLKPHGTAILCSAEEHGDKNNQYETWMEDLVAQVRNHDLTIRSIREWRPPWTSNDWYNEKRPRFILSLQKK